MPEIEFQVGQVYRNREGEYEVLSLDPATRRMEVRFLQGNLQKSLDMGIQSRIIQNLRIEAKLAAAAAEAPPEKPARPSRTTSTSSTTTERKALGKDFTGMRRVDFSGAVDGTNWRSRGSLAGALGTKLKRALKTKAAFKTYPVSRCPAVHLSHRADLADAAEISRVAKFTVQAAREGLHFGFYAERVDESCADWDRLVRKLREDDTLRQYASKLERDGFRFEGRRGLGQEHWTYADGPDKGTQPLWSADASWEERLKALEAPFVDEETRELYFLWTLTPDEAMDLGTGLVDEIGGLFSKLAPFYSAAAMPIGE